MARIHQSNQAKADLKRIWRFIALDSENQADRFLMRLNRRIEGLADFPESGPRQDHLRPGFRMVVVAGYRILYEYQTDANAVEIVAVVEPSRNLDDMF